MKIGFIIILIVGVIAFIPLQMLLPFPFGIGLGIGVIVIGIVGALRYQKLSNKANSREISRVKKFCTECGRELSGKANYCAKCGSEQQFSSNE